MEISLLLSAAQSAPSNEHSRSSAQTFVTTNSVSYDGFQTSTTLTNNPPPTYVRPQPPMHVPVGELPSFSRLLTPPNSLSPVSHTIEKKSIKPFHCNFEGCEATFGQKGSLTRHIKSRHQKLRPHTCDVCQKSFSALWTLRVHQRNVHLKAKPHKCHLCDKSFGELFNKSKHIAIVHEGKRPFACPYCARAFGYKGDMRKHVLELHQQSGRPFQCSVPNCGVKFARKRYLRRHENLSHKANGSSTRNDGPQSPTLVTNGIASAPNLSNSSITSPMTTSEVTTITSPPYSQMSQQQGHVMSRPAPFLLDRFQMISRPMQHTSPPTPTPPTPQSPGAIQTVNFQSPSPQYAQHSILPRKM